VVAAGDVGSGGLAVVESQASVAAVASYEGGGGTDGWDTLKTRHAPKPDTNTTRPHLGRIAPERLSKSGAEDQSSHGSCTVDDDIGIATSMPVSGTADWPVRLLDGPDALNMRRRRTGVSTRGSARRSARPSGRRCRVVAAVAGVRCDRAEDDHGDVVGPTSVLLTSVLLTSVLLTSVLLTSDLLTGTRRRGMPTDQRGQMPGSATPASVRP
jgi:hypothetical protein